MNGTDASFTHTRRLRGPVGTRPGRRARGDGGHPPRRRARPGRRAAATITALLALHLVAAAVMIPTLTRSLRTRTAA
ncbi:hypothetical protein [Actinomadura madurae]|uniref:hypothetical protein n=1 Tax=Actinomadura madurae TaxID=1993 RepID=UPI0020D1FBA0|nr:hypothetical protein [Actinomadura madurae]MCQ0007277.1 hypothetical protein [Actinomadura madurae]